MAEIPDAYAGRGGSADVVRGSVVDGCGGRDGRKALAEKRESAVGRGGVGRLAGGREVADVACVDIGRCLCGYRFTVVPAPDMTRARLSQLKRGEGDGDGVD